MFISRRFLFLVHEKKKNQWDSSSDGYCLTVCCHGNAFPRVLSGRRREDRTFVPCRFCFQHFAFFFFFFRCVYIVRASVSTIDSPFVGLPIAYVALWTAQTAASFNMTTVAKIMLLFCGTMLSVVRFSVRGLLEFFFFFPSNHCEVIVKENVTAKWQYLASISYEVVERFAEIIMWNVP